MYARLCYSITKFINCNRRINVSYNNYRSHPRPTTTVHHHAQSLSPKARLTLKPFIAHGHNPIVPLVMQLAAGHDSFEDMQRTELCKGSTPDDKRSILHVPDQSQTITQSCCVLSICKFTCITVGGCRPVAFYFGACSTCAEQSFYATRQATHVTSLFMISAWLSIRHSCCVSLAERTRPLSTTTPRISAISPM